MEKFPDVYRYDYISEQLRVQIIHIIHDAIDVHDNQHDLDHFQNIHDTLCREYGKFSLQEHSNGYINDVLTFMLKTDNIEQVIDVV